MVDFEKEFSNPGFNVAVDERTAVASVFKSVYGWMCAGLAISGGIAWYTFTSGLWQRIFEGGIFMGLPISGRRIFFGTGPYSRTIWKHDSCLFFQPRELVKHFIPLVVAHDFITVVIICV